MWQYKTTFVQQMEQETIYKGKISFVNYEKQFATIDYLKGAKHKTVNCKTTEEGANKKPHQFRLGDVISFQLKLSDRGDKQTAHSIKYLHNEAINLLLQKSLLENRFTGYLKKVEDKYFVKEIDSYILFPLLLSPWEKPPVNTAENEAIMFRFFNLEKPNALQAELFSHNYIPAYKKAIHHFENEVTTEATVVKSTPHGIHVAFFDNEVQAKLPAMAGEEIKEGTAIKVKITHLTPFRIVIKKA